MLTRDLFVVANLVLILANYLYIYIYSWKSHKLANLSPSVYWEPIVDVL